VHFPMLRGRRAIGLIGASLALTAS
jgi:hypothetical protein